MKRMIIASLAALVTALAPALYPSSPASASSLPKVQTAGMGGNWHQTWRVRPSTVYFGAHFLIKRLRYTYYSQHSAYARGRLFLDTCRPDCAHGGYYVNAGAYFHGVFYHTGPGRHFKYLKLTWHKHTKLMRINSSGSWTWH